MTNVPAIAAAVAAAAMAMTAFALAAIPRERGQRVPQMPPGRDSRAPPQLVAVAQQIRGAEAHQAQRLDLKNMRSQVHMDTTESEHLPR